MLNILDKFTPEELEDIILKFQKQVENESLFEESWVKRFEKVIVPMSDLEFEEKFMKYLKWEKAFQGHPYDGSIYRGPSNIFDILHDFIRIHGKNNWRNNEMFKSSSYIYRGFTWKLFIGQGSFVRIQKSSKIVFQTT